MATINFKKDFGAKTPCYAYEGDAGLDIFANEEKVILPNHRARIKTGLYLELPRGYVGLIWDKSGLAFLNGVHTMSGVIDSNYRGEIQVVLVNLSSKLIKIEKGMKIAQLLVQKVENVTLKETSKLKESERGEKGFGSSGVRTKSITNLKTNLSNIKDTITG